MPIAHGGIAKLIEECGELQQDLGKYLTYGMGEHPDGKGPLDKRIEDEMADVLAAMRLVIVKHEGLDTARINFRADQKYKLFLEWDKRE
jgi:NTP pyrophosphatase (non-canonical NTP hydrolase)